MLERLGPTGHLWCAVGLDYRPCSMRCRFCAFAADWTSIRGIRRLEPPEVVDWVRHFVAEGGRYIVLRTSEAYDADRLCRMGRAARKVMPVGARLIANTRELDVRQAGRLREAGFDGVYRTVRLREGVDTDFDPARRARTIEALRDAGLKVYSLLEPIGPEHTDEELAEGIVLLRDRLRPALIGVMGRIPVPGSPLAERGAVDAETLANIQAVVVLALLPHLPDVELVCSHPPSAALLEAGANGVVVEVGAVPRDARFSESEWHQFTAADARDMLQAAGRPVA